MTNWEEITFESVYEEPSKNGLTRVTSERGEGYPMVNMNEIFAYGRICDQDMELVLLNDREKKNHGLNHGDLLFARQSLVASGAGKCSIMVNPPPTITFESHLIRVRIDKKKANPFFFYNYFNSPQGKLRMQSLVIQVAASGVRGSELAKLKVRCPDKATQDKITYILSKYEDLIEHYEEERRILLEIISLLYVEWFLKYNFPGHEACKFENSKFGNKPVDWDVINLKEHVDFVKGIEPGSDNYFDEPDKELVPFIRVGDMGSRGSELFVPLELTKGKILELNDIALTLDGSVGLVRIGLSGAYSGGIRKISIKKNSYLNKAYVFELLRSYYVQKIIDAYAVGTTILHAGEAAKKIEFVLPPKDIMEKFQKITEPIFNDIFKVKRQIDQINAEREYVTKALMNEQISLNTIERVKEELLCIS